MRPNISSTQWMLMLLMLVIQSSMGMSLGLSAIWSDLVNLEFLIGEQNAAVFLMFSKTALGVNITILTSPTIILIHKLLTWLGMREFMMNQGELENTSDWINYNSLIRQI